MSEATKISSNSIFAQVMPRLSREERLLIERHLKTSSIALSSIGLISTVLGFLSYKYTFVLVGLFLVCISTTIYFAIRIIEHRAALIIAKNQLIPELTILEDLVEKSRKTYEACSQLSVETNDPKAIERHLHYLSLGRLITSIDQRLDDISKLLNSSSLDKIAEAKTLASAPLVFGMNCADHLKNHKMPDMPRSSWEDSLHVLSSRLAEHISKLPPPSKNALNSLQVSKDDD